MAKATLTRGVTRGPASWAYIYVMLGFVLTFEAGVVALIEPLRWPRNFIVYLGICAFTIYLWLFSGWFQNKLIGLKARYESNARPLGCVPVVVSFIVIAIASAGAWFLFPPRASETSVPMPDAESSFRGELGNLVPVLMESRPRSA